MKKKQIGIIILAIGIIGALGIGTGYKASSQKVEEKSEKTTNKIAIKSNDEQKENETKIEANSKDNEVNEKAKVVKTLSNDEENIKKANSEWNDLNSFYSQIRMAGNGSIEDVVWYSEDSDFEYAKEILKKTNAENIVDTGVASKENVDKEISFLKEYIEKKQEAINKQKEAEEQGKIDSKKEEQENKKLDAEHAKLKTTEEKEAFYYNQISKAMKRQAEYIDSLKDQKDKQSVQTSYAAAVSEGTFLEMRYPKDADIIKASLNKILDKN